MGNRSSAAAATTSATQINHNNDNHNINDKDNKALQQFHDAMAAVPLETKRDYWTAVQQVPDVVDRESNPLRFIRYARDNFWAAAERMCAYWQLRVQLWGRHRAWRPLTMDGTGALNEQDILVLQAGFPAVLPPSADGKQVIFFDRSKWLPSVTDRDNRLRATFYLLVSVNCVCVCVWWRKMAKYLLLACLLWLLWMNVIWGLWNSHCGTE